MPRRKRRFMPGEGLLWTILLAGGLTFVLAQDPPQQPKPKTRPVEENPQDKRGARRQGAQADDQKLD
ncbi:MAG: hypothetical protein ACKOB4_10630, partial [Acidobacteriota bacterium]